ncbi:MAG: DNA primase catalytic subunit PriS [Euryarchaeota archaeon]|nr:DNA primase catalytic subunit PriS [Euryarchaeota archaeon]
MQDELRPQDVWLSERFADYYRRNPTPMPAVVERFREREFGFLFHGQKFFLRHVGMPTPRELRQFMIQRAPAHAYYSTAFYQDPNAKTMVEKGWRGAELIFDLDADHVPGAEKLGYRAQLEKVKDHFLRLVEDFVMRDFGFAEKDLLLTFSGGRGYHCHVLHGRALGLNSAERREIVDFVTGTGLQLNAFIRPMTLRTKGFGRFQKADNTVVIPADDEPGWGGRINEAIRLHLAALKALPAEKKDDVLRMNFNGITKARLLTLQKDLDHLDEDRIRGVRFPDGTRRGIVDVGVEIYKYMERTLTFDTLVPLAKGETDEPVTSDVKRLIRLPGSLHGKSGLRVVTLDLDDIRGFDPLADAVAFGTEPIRIRVEKPANVDVAGFQADLPVGEATVPEAAAVMLMCRGAAVPI